MKDSWKTSTYKWSCRLKALEQMTQPYFLSSLCVSLCLAKALELLNALPQTGQLAAGRWPGPAPSLPGLPLGRGLSGPMDGAAIGAWPDDEELELDEQLDGCCTCCWGPIAWLCGCWVDCCWLRWLSPAMTRRKAC